MGNCEVQVAREPAIASCKATQHGRWVIMTDGTSQKKKSALEKETCRKGIGSMSIEVRHGRHNKIVVGDCQNNF